MIPHPFSPDIRKQPLFDADALGPDASDDEKRTHVDEQYLDLMWNNYLEANSEFKKKIRSQKKIQRLFDLTGCSFSAQTTRPKRRNPNARGSDKF